MKFRSLFCLFLLAFSANSQIMYRAVIVDQCSGRKVDYYHCAMINANGKMEAVSYGEEMELSSFGTYYLVLEWSDTLEIQVNSNHQIDTFFTVNLEIPLCICSPPPTEYQFCYQTAEGYLVDYYAPGVIRRKGTFKKGHPIDTVKTFYYSGELMELDIPLLEGNKWVRFYKNGNVKREFNSNKSEDLEYFESGQLSRFLGYRKRGRSIEKEYYENGQLKRIRKKRKEVHYSPYGSETEILRRKVAYGYFNRRNRMYEIKWSSYDSSGVIGSETTFRMFDEYPAYPKQKSKIDSTDIESIVLFEQGKPKKKIVVNSVFIDNEFVYRTTSFKKENNKWIRIRTGTLYHLREFL